MDIFQRRRDKMNCRRVVFSLQQQNRRKRKRKSSAALNNLYKLLSMKENTRESSGHRRN